MIIENEKFINPLTDFGFKKLFGREPNKNLLIDFLNEILPEQHKIEDLTYAKNEHVGQQIVDRTAIFDIYSSFPIQEQAKKGDWNDQLKPIYTVGILDFKFDEHKKDHDIVHLVELKDQNCEMFFDKLKFIYIELPKFQKSEEELNSHFDKWLFVFTHLSKLQDRPKRLQEKIFQQLFEAAEIANLPKEDREAYEESLKHYLDIKNVVDTSRLDGIKEVAKKMKLKEMSIENISDLTGLSNDEIDKL